jgi:hypothetical protein
MMSPFGVLAEGKRWKVVEEEGWRSWNVCEESRFGCAFACRAGSALLIVEEEKAG